MAKISFLLLLALFSHSLITKGQTVQRQTFSSLGFIRSDRSSLLLHHSAGQLSVNGSFSTASQGFLKGFLPARSFQKIESFSVLPYPNSFSERVTLRFYPESFGASEITIYDLYGKRVFHDIQNPINNEVHLNLEFLSNSVYLVFIKAGSRITHTRIIKKS
ncbi:T9SS type A sorting domain-containing protein [Algoriphagus sanaruensis]|uniref:Secretion system C-terminal sorting domain-containing protein n=1 Tax=Algoriphagus sanaruensis TaxID=1727163 RepID=A0A142EPN3_9BACT|nr:hypothetical protein AO498_11625 [Algoriphagus sanaruensis]